jgi:hypothetical protein
MRNEHYFLPYGKLKVRTFNFNPTKQHLTCSGLFWLGNGGLAHLVSGEIFASVMSSMKNKAVNKMKTSSRAAPLNSQ